MDNGTKTSTEGSFDVAGPMADNGSTTDRQAPQLSDLTKMLELKPILVPPMLGVSMESFGEWKHDFTNILTPWDIDNLLEAAEAYPHDVPLADCIDRN